MTVFIGLDLAWSSRHGTGAVAFEWDEATQKAVWLDSPVSLGGNDAIVEWVERVAGAGPERAAWLAIDAPLVVPNLSGARPGDRLISQVFRTYQAGTHPANRTNLGRYGQPVGDIRGETLAARLVAELGFSHNPYLEKQQPGRYLFECYPHPAMVVLFKLSRTLKYKRKLKSLDNDRFAAYHELQQHLGRLAEATPALVIPPEQLARDTRQLAAGPLKHYEDWLDACMCAYIALYYWWWGPERSLVFGSLAEGYIVAPVTDELRQKAQNQTQIGS